MSIMQFFLWRLTAVALQPVRSQYKYIAVVKAVSRAFLPPDQTETAGGEATYRALHNEWWDDEYFSDAQQFLDVVSEM